MSEQHLYQIPLGESDNCAECGKDMFDPAHISIPGPEKRAPTPVAIAPELADIVEKLATRQFDFIRTHDLGGFDGYDHWLERDEKRYNVTGWQIERLIQLGFIEGGPGGWRLSDAGRVAYIKSTDEMGDGKLRPPSASSESRPSEPTTYAEIQQRIGELHGEIHRLAAKITGDPSQGVMMRATRSPYDCGPNPTKDYPGE